MKGILSAIVHEKESGDVYVKRTDIHIKVVVRIIGPVLIG